MSRHMDAGARADKAWVKLYAAVAVLPLALAACGGGGGGGSSSPVDAPTPAPAPAASLTVTASAASTTAGGSSITLTATVANSTATPTWSLNGPGTLSATSGTSVVYTPPAAGTLTANGAAIVSASLTGATTQSVTLLVTLSAAVAGVNWAGANAAAVGNLQAVDYADGRWVAVSDSGAGLTSADAITWTAATPLTSSVPTDHLDAYAVTHLGGTLVAAGAVSSAPYTTSTGAVASSSDGLHWTAGSLPAGATPIHALIAGTRLVGLGETGHLYASTDGQAWSALTTLGSAVTLNAGVYNGSAYVAVGDGGTIAYSTDSIAWQSGAVISSGGSGINLHGVAWTGSQFVAVGDDGAISTSPNGTSWSALKTSAISGALRAVAVSSTGLIVVVGDNGIETSPDGSTWTARSAASAAALDGVAFANGQFVAVGASSAVETSVSTQP